MLQHDDSQCRNTRKGTESEKGILASVITISTGCGSVANPWVIRVNEGQRINITLLDFSGLANETRQAYNLCRVYAVLKDLGSGKSITVCGGKFGSEIGGYMSDTNEIEVRLPGVKDSIHDGHFLLVYEG